MILAIGNSVHLLEAIRSYERADVRAISWRQLETLSTNIRIDKIYLIGYDYASYGFDYQKYIHKNVFAPLHYVLELRARNYSVPVVYINTLSPKKRYTFSRYLYAKQMLENELSKHGATFCVRLPTIVNNHNFPIAASGPVTKFIFRVLILFGMVHVVKETDVAFRLRDCHQPCSYVALKPIGLKLRRYKMLDRLLRLILG